MRSDNIHNPFLQCITQGLRLLGCLLCMLSPERRYVLINPLLQQPIRCLHFAKGVFIMSPLLLYLLLLHGQLVLQFGHPSFQLYVPPLGLNLTDTGGEDRAGPPQRDTGHWADEMLKELKLNKEKVHYIPTLHWVGETGRKNTQIIPTSKVHAHRIYKMKVVVQTVQQSTRPRITDPRAVAGDIPPSESQTGTAHGQCSPQ